MGIFGASAGARIALAFFKLLNGAVESLSTLTYKSLLKGDTHMSLIQYTSSDLSTGSPFDRLASLRDEMNRLFEAPLLSRKPNLFHGWNPALDIRQDKDNVYVSAELPGLKKEAIEISLQDGVLTLAGERRQEAKEDEKAAVRNERYFGRFSRSVTLPTRVDADKVSAHYQDGILKVTLPKAEEVKPKQIAITVA